MNRVVVFVIAGTIALFAASIATAGNGTSKAGYGGEAAVQVTLVESTEAASNEATQTLPLTGLDLALFMGGGLILVLVGLGMRRAARQRN